MHTEAVPQPEPTGARLWVRRVENAAINAVILVMVSLPILEGIGRITGVELLSGSASIVQHLTLWAAFLGALLCTRERAHLGLSTAELIPEGRPRQASQIFHHSISAAVTAVLAYAAYELVVADMSSNTKVFGDVPIWWVETIMPVTFAFMAMRLIMNASPSWLGRLVAVIAVGAALSLGLIEEPSHGVVLIICALIFLALLAGAPIYVAMGGLALVLFYGDQTPVASVPTETLRLVISPSLPAIPLLTIAGYILGEGGAAKRLVKVCQACFGWFPGGLAVVVCLVCALFTAFTGGSGVTILALGGLVYPVLIADKYPEGFSLGLVTASGSLGLLFPPSLPVILYSVVAGVSDLNALFVAGLVPGILMIGLVCAYGVYVGIKNKTPRTPFRLDDAARSMWEAKWELALPIFVGGAIIGGWATIVESAALACAYAIIVEVFVFKDIPVRELPATVVRGATLVGAVLIVLGVALGLTSYLVDADVPSTVIAWVKAHIETQFGFLLVLNALLLVLGSVLEIYSAIVVLAPLVVPLGEAYEVDKIHLAVVFLANLELGFLFPPVGLNLFLASTRFKKPLVQMYKHAFPFLCIMAAGVLLITYVPAMTVGVLEKLGMAEPKIEATTPMPDEPAPTEEPAVVDTATTADTSTVGEPTL